MKIIFWGTPELAVPILNELCLSSHSILAVVTQPDRCQGRHHSQTCFSPVKKMAIERQIPILQPESAKDPAFFEELKRLDADAMVLAAYGEILPKPILQLPKYGFINVHFSLLPKYRGASPIVSALLAGDHEVGISIMQVTNKLDAGPVFGQKSIPVLLDDTKETLEGKLANLAGKYLIEILEQIFAGTITAKEQDHSQATFCSLITKEHGKINWDSPAIAIERHIRAMNPWPLSHSVLQSKKKGELPLIIHEAKVHESNYPIARAGEIVDIGNHGIIVATAKDALCILRLQRSGKSILGAKEFLQGCPIEIGDVLL